MPWPRQVPCSRKRRLGAPGHAGGYLTYTHLTPHTRQPARRAPLLDPRLTYSRRLCSSLLQLWLPRLSQLQLQLQLHQLRLPQHQHQPQPFQLCQRPSAAARASSTSCQPALNRPWTSPWTVWPRLLLGGPSLRRKPVVPLRSFGLREASRPLPFARKG